MSIQDAWVLGIGVSRMLITVVVAVIIFRSVWVRRGYEGLNAQLEPHEVELFIKHVFGFYCLFELQYMDTTEAISRHDFPVDRYWLFGAGFLGDMLLLGLNISDRIKEWKKKITTRTETNLK